MLSHCVYFSDAVLRRIRARANGCGPTSTGAAVAPPQDGPNRFRPSVGRRWPPTTSQGHFLRPKRKAKERRRHQSGQFFFFFGTTSGSRRGRRESDIVECRSRPAGRVQRPRDQQTHDCAAVGTCARMACLSVSCALINASFALSPASSASVSLILASHTRGSHHILEHHKPVASFIINHFFSTCFTIYVLRFCFCCPCVHRWLLGRQRTS